MNKQISESEDLELLFTGRFADANQIPAPLLIQVLTGLQRTIHLLAMDIERLEVRKKDRVTGDIERKYAVFCSQSRAGSYQLRVHIGDPTCDLFAKDSIREVSESFQHCVEIVSEQHKGRLSEIVPHKVRRTRVLDSLRSMIPKKGSGIRLRVKRESGPDFFDSLRVQSGLRQFLPVGDDEEAIRTVTGRLSKIDFDEQKITIVYPVTNRDLDCIYDESVEDLLLENPREFIQVTGKVILDENDEPKRIVDVENIREVDLSPFYLEEFEYSEWTLRFRKPFMLEPELDETKQLICLQEPNLGIDIYAFTRDELDEVLSAEIDALWRNYAMEEDDKLTPQAQELKRNLKDALQEEITSAA